MDTQLQVVDEKKTDVQIHSGEVDWDLAKRMCAPGATDDEFGMFMAWCKRKNLNPLTKQAFFTIQKSKCQICKADPAKVKTCSCDNGYVRVPTFMEAIDGLLSRANQFPNFAGIFSSAVYTKDNFEFDALKGEPTKHTFGADRGVLAGAWAKIEFKGGRSPMSFYYPKSEYDGGPVAGAKPSMMLQKAAMSILLRRAFPEPHLAGDAYTPEEFGATVVDGQLNMPMKEEQVQVQTSAPVKQVAAPKTVTDAAKEMGAVVENRVTEPVVVVDGSPLYYRELQQKDGSFVQQVHINFAGADAWVPAGDQIKIKQATFAEFKKLFKNDFDMNGHLKKHFNGVNTPMSLTWEEFAAVIAWKRDGKGDPRWYEGAAPKEVVVEKVAEEVLVGVDLSDNETTILAGYGCNHVDDTSIEFVKIASAFEDPMCLKVLIDDERTKWDWANKSQAFLDVAKLVESGAIVVGDEMFWEAVR